MKVVEISLQSHRYIHRTFVQKSSLCNLIVVYTKKDVKVCGEKLSHRYIDKKVVEFFSAIS
jgi:hypothetical protein